MADVNKGGRPTKFTQELADTICDTIATSNKSMRTIALENNISMTSVLRWLNENSDFSSQYARAKEMQADFLAEEMLEIADDSSRDTQTIFKDGKEIKMEDKEWTGRSRLRIESRKWIAAKLKPKKYGDKLDLTSAGEKFKPLDLSSIPTELLMSVLQRNATSTDDAE